MLITKEQAEKRLNSPKNLINTIEHNGGKLIVKEIIKGGNRLRTPNLTNEERALVAVTAITTNGPSTAEAFGVSKDAVKNWRLGRTKRPAQLAGVNHPELEQAIEDRLGIVRDKALDKLMESLGLIDKDKLDKQSALNLSTISNNLASVVSKTFAKETARSSAVNVIVYSPPVKDISNFKVVET